MSNATTEEPPPVASYRTPAWELVIKDVRTWWAYVNMPLMHRPEIVEPLVADMMARDQLGRERYGRALTSHNGRNHLVDLYQELLDAAVYARAWLDENGWPGAGCSWPGYTINWVQGGYTDGWALCEPNAARIRAAILATYENLIQRLLQLKQEIG